jgi:Fe2+ or Zn2+ uptake regulation protein
MSEGTKPGPDPSVTDDELLQIFRDHPDPVLSTREVTEQVPLKRRAVYNRLSALQESGKLRGKKVGGRSTIYWLPTERE